jgi:endonuclease G
MKKPSFNLPTCLSLLVVATLTGCTTVTTLSRVPAYSAAKIGVEAGLSPQDQKRVDENCIFGLPKLDPQINFGPTDLVARDGYVLLHSAADKIALFVCEHVSAPQLKGNLARDDKFQADPLLKTGRRAELKDYAGSGYDRGHQAPAGDQTTDKRLKAETFYLSNMAPQIPALNRQIWKELETQARDWAEKRGSAYIITGPMFYNTNEESAVTATGLVHYKVIGPDAVAVPTHFYKIIVAKDSLSQWQAIGFVLENRKYPTPKGGDHYHWEEFIKSIDWIQKRTGVDFMPEADRDEAKRLENTASALWN